MSSLKMIIHIEFTCTVFTYRLYMLCSEYYMYNIYTMYILIVSVHREIGFRQDRRCFERYWEREKKKIDKERKKRKIYR